MYHLTTPTESMMSYWGKSANYEMPALLGSGIVTGVLGHGGQAVVYEIWNKELGVRRAVKLLRPDHTNEHRKRFKTEIKVTAQLDHANIIRIHSVGEWNGLPFIEMEKVDGFSLHQLIDDHGALPIDVALAVGLIISRALSYTHHLDYEIDGEQRVGILHRDLKPANILISKKGVVRLTDFGIATPVNVSMHTPDGSIVGSLQYIAPEQLRGEEIDRRADIFSFGCVMYEMLTGFKVFPEKRVAPLVQKRLANEFDKLNMYKLDLPPRLKKLIRQCLDTNRQKRPENMGYISRELGRIFDSIAHGSPEMVIKHYIETVGDKVNVVFFKPSLKWITIGACASILVTCALLGVTYHEQISSFAEYVSGSLEAAPPAEFGTVQAAVISQSPDTKVTYIPDKAENKAKTIMAKDEFKRRR